MKQPARITIAGIALCALVSIGFAGTSTKSDFEKRYVKIDRTDLSALTAFAEQALAGGHENLANRAYRAVLRIDTDHAQARKQLGFAKFGGEWASVDQVKKERGLDYVDGQWLAPGDTPTKPVAEAQPVKVEPKKEEEPKKKEEPKEWIDDHETVATWEEAAIFKSKHYEIRSNIKPEYVKRYADLLERYWSRFDSIFSPLSEGFPKPKKKNKRSPIKIYADSKVFLSTEKKPKGVGGFYRLDTGEVACYHGRFGKTGTTQNVIGHECAHQFQHRETGQSFTNCPIWLIEGLATIFESAEWDMRRKKVVIGKIAKDRMETMKRALKAGKVIPLSTLFRTPQQSFSGYHYAHAWSLMYMCLFGVKSKSSRQKNTQFISKLINMGRSQRVRYRDVLKLLGGEAELAKLEEYWKKWIEETPMDYEP